MLESQVAFEVSSDLFDESLEGKFPDEQVSRSLVFSDFSESDGSWLESMRFLDANVD